VFFIYAALKYKLPNFEERLKELEDNMKKHMEDMSKNFVKREEIWDKNDNPRFQPSKSCELLHKHLCGQLESISDGIQDRLNEFDQKREDTRREISRLYSDVAAVVSRTNTYIEEKERRTSGEVAEHIARVVAEKMTEAVKDLVDAKR
jgi:uncharacterized coiled-coil DUF342 family protein